MQLQFVKMNGAGNDFVMLDNRDLSLRLTKDQIASLCDRQIEQLKLLFHSLTARPCKEVR